MAYHQQIILPNYFDIFELGVQFNLDKSDLRKRFIRLSRNTHPDLQSGSDALEQSTLVNKAYKVLSDDFLRTRYVLELMGKGIEQTDTVPMDFLMEMMEWNERIESAADHPDQQPILIQDFKELKQGVESALLAKTQAFDQDNEPTLLDDIREICLQQKYLLRMQESIDKFAPR
ncbi:MAG: Fe-S protein assembly co-chaperone HscB [Flavobacteriales bacterium]|nr:Fe-S protein assembly co-chaperone HscB [Bacteroidota bacterium]MCB9239531.1 Fe-S protein assembly co-chaperone HscB [Flavobacteriales bacterium]